jgi:hypothetical protein
MSYKIIVARYNENIEWLNSEMNNCIIYNKGNKLNITNEIILDNVGRESESYLQYIITNYNNLPDVVVFTQARISDHRRPANVNYLINLKNDALQNGKSKEEVVHYKSPYNSCWNPNWNILDNGTYFLHNHYKNDNRIIFIDWFKKNINDNYPEPIRIYSNGIFAVKKELILMNSLEYYKNLILEVNHHLNPAEGHFFERSWYYIFSKK